MTMYKIAIMSAALLILSSVGIAQAFQTQLTGKVTSVLDGDTVKIGSTKIRFVAIDAPELSSGRSTATDARDYVKNHCLNKTAIVDINDPRKKDSSGRTLADIVCGADVKSMNQLLLENDFAVLYRHYACDPLYNEFFMQPWVKC